MCFPSFDVDALNYLCTMTELTELDVLASSDTHTPICGVVLLSNLRCLTITERKGAAGSSKEFFCALIIPALSQLTLNYHNTLMLHFPMSPLLSLSNLVKLGLVR